ncbi:hypothetical protein LCGC14_0641260 [marine sediment metagenome]|uniref:DNA methylase N-4/N-6 domain-containing protein n=1 Tax=marine sediment metagenome TaxID=412755 RepID=A0A0F9TKG6_9ZZZZ
MRDYGVKGQIGLEPTLEEFISKLLKITAELKRVLKPTGVMYWNHGDCYGGSQGRGEGKGNEYGQMKSQKKSMAKCLMLQNYRLIIEMINQGWILRNTIIWHKPNHMPSSVKDRFSNSYEPVFMLVKNNNPQYYYNTKTGLMMDRKPKELKKGIDWGFEEIGIIDKNTFNVRVKDAKKKRFLQGATKEEIENYKKGKIKKVNYWQSIKYWFDLDAVRVPSQEPNQERPRMGQGNQTIYKQKRTKIPKENAESFGSPRARRYRKTQDKEYLEHFRKKGSGGHYDYGGINDPKARKEIIKRMIQRGKNPGDVWKIATQPFPEAHFATFPVKLITPMILSSCPKEICKKCGKARVRIVKGIQDKKPSNYRRDGGGIMGRKEDQRGGLSGYKKTDFQTLGWTDCKCKAGFEAGITLDPFIGSGTVGVVARRYGRNWLGIELNPKYIKMAKQRITAQPVPML